MRAERLEKLREYCRDDAAFEALRTVVCELESHQQHLEALLTSPQRQSGDALQQAPFQSLLLDQLSQAVIATDQHGHITYWNRRAEVLFQWRATEVIGRDLDDLLMHVSDRKTARKVLICTMKVAPCRDELLLQRKDGGQVWVDITRTLLHDATGQAIGFVGMAVAMSERKQAQAMLELQAELTQANAALQAEIAERRQTEAALQQAEVRYRSIFENAIERYFSKHARWLLFEC